MAAAACGIGASVCFLHFAFRSSHPSRRGLFPVACGWTDAVITAGAATHTPGAGPWLHSCCAVASHGPSPSLQEVSFSCRTGTSGHSGRDRTKRAARLPQKKTH